MNFDLILPFLRPIEPLLLDDGVSEILGNPDTSWYAEREGKLTYHSHQPACALASR